MAELFGDHSGTPRWANITAYFGGAFDPPHLGHRQAIEGLLREPGVRAVRVLPAGNPVLKTAQTPAAHRLAMARLAFGDLAEIDEREIRRPDGTPTYTFDTLGELRAEFGASIAFVVGVDHIENFDRWHRFPEVMGQAHWIALEREPDGKDRMERALARLASLGAIERTSNPRVWRPQAGGATTVLVRVPTPAPAMSSTQVRRNFAFGNETGADDSLSPAIRAYIREHRLYGMM